MKMFMLSSFLLASLTLTAQKNKDTEKYFVFDSSWNPTNVDNATYLSVLQKLNDTAYQWKNYHFSGPLINIETYKDLDATILNGFIAFYGADGQVDSSGYSLNGKKDSTWYYYDDTLAIFLQKDYKNGILINTVDHYKKRKDYAMENPTNVLVEGESEADFVGGIKAWHKYLQNNYQAPDRGAQLGKKGMIKIGFVVDVNGIPVDLRILKSIEYSLDKEALRLIKESPKWKPAFQKGRKVKAFRIQPITID